MTDLTDMLRGEGNAHMQGNVRDRRTIGALMLEAADEIDRLRYEIERLEAREAELAAALQETRNER